MNISIEDMASNSKEAELFLKQLANSNRLMILCVLLTEELSVSQLNDQIPLSQSALSQHLARLREAGFVDTRRESQTIFYRLADDRIKPIIQELYKMFCAS